MFKMKNKNNRSNANGINLKDVSNEDDSSSSSIVLDDPCAPKEPDEPEMVIRTPGLDPRFQQQNQTLRCFVMYTDFHQCEHLLGEGHEACSWFKNVYTSICPQAWVENWDVCRAENRMPWFKRAEFPKAPYGK